MATQKKGGKPDDGTGDDEEDPYENWTPDQPIPDEEGEEAARKRSIVERRTEYLKDQASKKKKKKAGSGSGWGFS